MEHKQWIKITPDLQNVIQVDISTIYFGDVYLLNLPFRFEKYVFSN